MGGSQDCFVGGGRAGGASQRACPAAAIVTEPFSSGDSVWPGAHLGVHVLSALRRQEGIKESPGLGGQEK